MGSSLYVLFADSATLAEMAESGGFARVMESGIDFGQLGWAIVSLAVGEPGVGRFDDQGNKPAGLQVPVMSTKGLAKLAEVAVVDRAEIEQRFDAGDFGEKLGPLPELEERDDVAGVALHFAHALIEAHQSGQHMVWLLS